MNQDWDLRGQAVQRKCPKCHAMLRWSTLHGSAERIADARDRHFDDCPAAALDPRRLTRMSKAEVEAALAGLNTDDPDPAEPGFPGYCA